MNKKLRILYLIYVAAVATVIWSCENEISFREEKFVPQLIMNGFIDSDSLTHSLSLCLTGEREVALVGDVAVTVQVNGVLKETLRPERMENSNYRKALFTTRFEPGDVVRIEALTDDGQYHAWMEETVPQPIAIDRVDTMTVVYKTTYGSHTRMRVKVNFKDRPNEKNYYRIVLEEKDRVNGETEEGKDTTVVSTYYDFWPWEDMALTDGSPATSEELDNDLFERVTNLYGVFDDSWFRDSEYTLTVQLNVASGGYYPSNGVFIPKLLNVDVTVKLLSITESEYYYLNTLNILDSDVLDEYISDPIKIPSNIHGGTGFVGINAGNSKTLCLVKDKELEYIFTGYKR